MQCPVKDTSVRFTSYYDNTIKQITLYMSKIFKTKNSSGYLENYTIARQHATCMF